MDSRELERYSPGISYSDRSKKRKDNTVSRLKRILAYEFSGQFSYASCDIPTRNRIDALIPKLIKVFGQEAAKTAVDLLRSKR